jgi:uncharacterized protein YbjQ (UPF0145 family)
MRDRSTVSSIDDELLALLKKRARNSDADGLIGVSIEYDQITEGGKASKASDRMNPTGGRPFIASE